MDSPIFITKSELLTLYEKIELYIRSNFPSCSITINRKSVSFGYPNELTRIFLYQDIEQTALILKITQDLTQPMDSSNGKCYKICSIEDIQYIKSGIRVILECKVPKVIVSSKELSPEVQHAAPSQQTSPTEQRPNRFKNFLSKF